MTVWQRIRLVTPSNWLLSASCDKPEETLTSWRYHSKFNSADIYFTTVKPKMQQHSTAWMFAAQEWSAHGWWK